MEEVSRLEHELLAALGNVKQAMTANTTYEKKLCDQAAERELDATRMTELERLQANIVAENARLKKAMEEASRREASMEEEVASLKKGKEAVEIELEKIMDDTMALINHSFDLGVRQTRVLYGGLHLLVNLTKRWRSLMAVSSPRMRFRLCRVPPSLHRAPSEDAEDRN